MRNLELKARFADHVHGEQTAQAIGATFGGDLRQVDTYFHVACGRLKLREVHLLPHGGERLGAGAELIAYARAEETPTRWSDYLTSPVGDAATMRDLLTRALGVRQRVVKTRRLYLYRGARIHLDEVESLGMFIEFEVPTDAGEETQAHEIMRELMQAFGVSEADAVQASYSELMEAAA